MSVNTGSVTLPKTAGIGVMVDPAAPTAGWRDITGQVIPDIGGSGPTKSAFRGGTVGMFSFAAADQIDIPFHIPHDWVPGTDIFVHVHWSHNGTAISGNIVFTITATAAKGHNQASFPAEKAQTLTYATVDITTTPRYIHRIDELQLSNNGGTGNLLDTAALEVDGLILINLTMTTIPTITGGAPNNPFIFQVDLHYQSTNVGTKQKAPNFYV
ncbi:MAG: hypothetical protein WC869_00825 [Phycisphaerae bacterium]|jgi:hypothetical protein